MTCQCRKAYCDCDIHTHVKLFYGHAAKMLVFLQKYMMQQSFIFYSRIPLTVIYLHERINSREVKTLCLFKYSRLLNNSLPIFSLVQKHVHSLTHSYTSVPYASFYSINFGFSFSFYQLIITVSTIFFHLYVYNFCQCFRICKSQIKQSIVT